MPILRRDDGVLFVLQPYRELLKAKSAALLKREFYLLSQQYGIYSRIFRQADGRFEAVFARDPGYLLGETVWQYFGKPQDLLYCEALPEKDQALVVIVRNGNVYLDAKLSYAQLLDELTPLQAGPANFAVYLYGDVPISKVSAKNKFTLENERVKSFMQLETPVWQALLVQEHLSLVSIEQAVTELKLNQRTYQVIAAIIAIIILSGIWIWFSNGSNISVTTQQQTIDPAQQYVQALTTADPAVQLQQIAKQLAVVYNITGWIPTSITYNENSMQVELHTLGGPIKNLLQWAEQQNKNVTLTPNGAQLTLPLAVTMRQPSRTISSTQQIIATLVDRMMQVMPTKSVQIATTTPRGIYSETAVAITLTNGVSPDVLSLVGKALAGLPVNLAGGTFALNNGLLTGTLQLTLLGN
jgi:hypothetical protein